MKTLLQKHPYIIGMIHLKPSPGFKGHCGMEEYVQHAVKELFVLQDGGVDAVLVENEHDHPHQLQPSKRVKRAIVAAVGAVVKQSRVPVGVEVLLNDPVGSLQVAAKAGAHFIRTDYFVDKMTRDGFGEMNIDPAMVVRVRDSLVGGSIDIFADIQVKYAQMIHNQKSLTTSAKQAENSGAQAIVVTGTKTGSPPCVDDIVSAQSGLVHAHLIIGSGVDIKNAKRLMKRVQGVIVGTGIQTNGCTDIDKVNELVFIRDNLKR